MRITSKTLPACPPARLLAYLAASKPHQKISLRRHPSPQEQPTGVLFKEKTELCPFLAIGLRFYGTTITCVSSFTAIFMECRIIKIWVLRIAY